MSYNGFNPNERIGGEQNVPYREDVLSSDVFVSFHAHLPDILIELKHP